MRKTLILNRHLALLVAVAFSVLVAVPPEARAVVIESQTADGQTISQRADDLQTVRTILERDVVVQRLADFGYTQQEALLKIQNATDEQLHQLASLSDNLAAGADGLGALVTLLVIALLVIIILKVSDKEVIIR